MTAEAFKEKYSSCWADFQYVGLVAHGIKARNSEKLYGGKATLPMDEYSGLIELLINQGGLTNGKVTPKAKELFKNEVMPALKESFPGLDGKFTGRIQLHYREGRLESFTY